MFLSSRSFLIDRWARARRMVEVKDQHWWFVGSVAQFIQRKWLQTYSVDMTSNFPSMNISFKKRPSHLTSRHQKVHVEEKHSSPVAFWMLLYELSYPPSLGVPECPHFVVSGFSRIGSCWMDSAGAAMQLDLMSQITHLYFCHSQMDQSLVTWKGPNKCMDTWEVGFSKVPRLAATSSQWTSNKTHNYIKNYYWTKVRLWEKEKYIHATKHG